MEVKIDAVDTGIRQNLTNYMDEQETMEWTKGELEKKTKPLIEMIT